MKLDVGCGVSRQAGFIGVDCAIAVRPHIVAEMWSIPLKDGSTDEIYSSHALEHVLKAEVVPTLREWERLLRPGGTVELQVPDLVWCCLNWLRHLSNDWHMDTIFGNQEHVPGELHKTGFTSKIMRSYVAQTTLMLNREDVVQSHDQPTLRFFLEKQR